MGRSDPGKKKFLSEGTARAEAWRGEMSELEEGAIGLSAYLFATKVIGKGIEGEVGRRGGWG